MSAHSTVKYLHGTSDRATLLARLPSLAAEIARGAAQRDLDRELPVAAFDLFRRSGLSTLRVPVHLGGPGGSIADLIEVISTLAAADSNVAHALRPHFNFCEGIVLSPGSAKADTYLSKVLDGALFGGASTELGTQRPGDVTSTLTRDGDRYRLNGKKYYATGTAFADYASFGALNDAGEFVSALLPVTRQGIHILDDWDGMGQRLTASGGVDLVDVEILPEEVAVRRSGNPFMRRHQATRAQLHLMAVIGGIVRNVLGDAVTYVQTKARSAKHSASETARGDHFVQQVVGEIAAASHIIDVTIADTARTLDIAAAAILAGAPDLDDLVLRGQLANSKAQIVVGKLAIRAAEQLFDTGGGSATSRKYNYDRHWRNIRTILNHNPLLLKGRVIGDYLLNGERDDFDEGRVF